jgi:hypothetical protein
MSQNIIEQALQIAWDFIGMTGQMENPREAGHFLLSDINQQYYLGERRLLMLANRAISNYQNFVKQKKAA